MIDSSARGAWRTLEVKLRPFIARRTRSESDVDDITQDIFLRMQRGLAGLRDDERFGPWVYQVARSAIIDHQRLTSRYPVTMGDIAALETVSNEEPVMQDDQNMDQELATYLATLIATLPSAYREALTFTEIAGHTQKETAAMLGISISGLKSRVQRGRAMLRKALEECCHIALDARGGVLSCSPRASTTQPEGCCA